MLLDDYPEWFKLSFDHRFSEKAKQIAHKQDVLITTEEQNDYMNELLSTFCCKKEDGNSLEGSLGVPACLGAIVSVPRRDKGWIKTSDKRSAVR